MTGWTQVARSRRWGLGWLAAGAVALTLASAGPAAAQTRTTTTTGGGTTAASSPPAVSQSALLEEFVFELMVEVAFQDWVAQGGGTPDQFLSFLEGTLGELIQPEMAAAGSGQSATLPDPGDDELLAFEDFLMEIFVAQVQADFMAQGGGTAAQFQTFLANALITAGQPQLANAAQQVSAANAKLAASSASSTSTTGTTTTSGTTTTGTTGTRTTTTGTTGTTTGTTGTVSGAGVSTGTVTGIGISTGTTGTGTTGTTGTRTGTTGTTGTSG
jgi:hypothetical protein